MKKLLAIIAAITMVLSLAACKKESKESAGKEETTSITQSMEDETTTEPEVQGDPAEYSAEYWEEKYPGENLCPFSIEENGKEYSYYWISGIEGWDGTMESWINQPFNWNGWHKTADGCIVNKDETLKITDNWATGEETMSSFCTVTTEPYEAP